ncbi:MULTISPECIES: hypothetical protein [Vibrio]|uniref:hypothetical protein n=1 Tax=Vibrio TaxID=662 RepID=UPI0012AFE437|nr:MULTISPECIES: hypothetical protein [Vibrio]MCC2521466.1 hypothetical protein [Vibrio coralliilyticus]MCM5507732.1 hypothetical protein [Vibrio sp. SCSIO 43169]MDE3899382.1 hypothetical protein [Vibrio sp. CC007]NRF13544.1 hypothetical protein [Vibrio coralliilyticus]NRF29654.1 hypothetical protein [Vibrio coralliilyticus]
MAMVVLGLVTLGIVVFFACWVCQHGLPVFGMQLDETDQLLLAEAAGKDVLEA